MRSSSSQHCSGMTSVPASVTREVAVISSDLLVGGSERDLRLTGVTVGAPGVVSLSCPVLRDRVSATPVYKPELSSASS